MRRSTFFAVAGLTLAAASLGSACLAQSDAPDQQPAAQVDRSADVELDASRRGPEIMQFIGVKSGDHVIDLIPSSGYWTRLFADLVGPEGRVDGLWPNSYAQADYKNVSAYLAMSQRQGLNHVRTYIEPAAIIRLDAPADIVFTSLNYHDYPDAFIGPVSPETLNRQVFDSLRPGGLYIVIDHAGAPGSGMTQIATLHRIEPQLVREQIEAAGFVFEAESHLLRNPDDDHTLSVFDEKIRGKTDRFIYKFRKPG
jgi:predicted methyltransferase